MTQTLLEKALAVKRNRPHRMKASDEEVDLAIAYMHGEITEEQVRIALGKASRNPASWAPPAIRIAIRDGRVRLERIHD